MWVFIHAQFVHTHSVDCVVMHVHKATGDRCTHIGQKAGSQQTGVTFLIIPSLFI